MYSKGHLTIPTYRRGPRTHTRTHKYPKEDGPQRSLFGSPAEEDSSAVSQDGWRHGRGRGWSSTHSRSPGRQRTDQGSRIQRRRDEVISLDENRLLAAMCQTRHLRSAGCSPPQTQAETRPRAYSGRKLLTLVPTTTLFLQEVGASSPGHSPPDWSDPSRDSLAVLHWTGPR